MENSYERKETASERIKEALTLRKMKQSELSYVTGISKANISCYVSGKYEPKQEALYRMGKALDVSEMWLAGYDVPMERPEWQKENDTLAEVIDRIKKEKTFRQLIIKINNLKSEQLEIIRKLIDQFQ